MNYDNFTTFNVETEKAIVWVTFDYPPVNIKGTAMLDDLNNLAEELECDRFFYITCESLWQSRTQAKP